MRPEWIISYTKRQVINHPCPSSFCTTHAHEDTHTHLHTPVSLQNHEHRVLNSDHDFYVHIFMFHNFSCVSMFHRILEVMSCISVSGRDIKVLAGIETMTCQCRNLFSFISERKFLTY